MPDEIKKPNCYECEYRGSVPGSAHSTCDHPKILEKNSNVFGAMFQVMQGKFKQISKDLEIKYHVHGFKNGWFFWPADFDPTWLLSCNGFKKKND